MNKLYFVFLLAVVFSSCSPYQKALKSEDIALKYAAAEEKYAPDNENKVDKKAQRQQSAAQRQQLKPLTNKLKNLESHMEKYQAKLADIETQLGDSSIYDDKNKAKLQQLLLDQAKVQQQLDEAEENWLLISEEIEAASN